MDGTLIPKKFLVMNKPVYKSHTLLVPSATARDYSRTLNGMDMKLIWMDMKRTCFTVSYCASWDASVGVKRTCSHLKGGFQQAEWNTSAAIAPVVIGWDMGSTEDAFECRGCHFLTWCLKTHLSRHSGGGYRGNFYVTASRHLLFRLPASSFL